MRQCKREAELDDQITHKLCLLTLWMLGWMDGYQDCSEGSVTPSSRAGDPEAEGPAHARTHTQSQSLGAGCALQRARPPIRPRTVWKANERQAPPLLPRFDCTLQARARSATYSSCWREEGAVENDLIQMLRILGCFKPERTTVFHFSWL